MDDVEMENYTTRCHSVRTSAHWGKGKKVSTNSPNSFFDSARDKNHGESSACNAVPHTLCDAPDPACMSAFLRDYTLHETVKSI